MLNNPLLGNGRSIVAVPETKCKRVVWINNKKADGVRQCDEPTTEAIRNNLESEVPLCRWHISDPTNQPAPKIS